MGYIKEPKGIDFIIQSQPLTEKARNEISEFIRNYKSQKFEIKSLAKKNTRKKKIQTV